MRAHLRSLMAAAVLAVICLPTSVPAAAQVLTRDQQLREAAKAQAAGDLEKAIGIYSSVLGEAGLPNDRRALILNDRAVARARLNRFERAFEDFNSSAQLFAENAALYNNRGAVLSRLGLHKEAVKDLDRALLLAPGYAAAYANRAVAHAELGRPVTALGDFNRAVKLAPKQALALTARADLYLAQQRPRAALRDLTRAVANDAKNPAVYKALAKARLALGAVDAAIQDYSRAVAFAPGDAEAYVDRGKAYLRSADAAAAERDFSKALELDPKRVEALRERGHARILLERFDDARADLTASLQIAPREAEAFAYRALMYKKMGQAQLGEREIRTAEQFNQTSATVMWARGEIYEALGNEDAAITSFRAALARRPDLAPARYGLNRLGERDKSQAIEIIAAPASGWDIIRRNGQFFARQAEPRPFEVPLETVADATPQVVDWTVRKVAGRDIGLLTYAQGRLTEAGKPVPLEAGVVIDIARRAELGRAPTRFGTETARVSWNAASIEIASVDGLTDEILLNRQRLAPAAGAAAAAASQRRRRSARRRARARREEWVPWERANRPRARSGPRRRSRSRRRRRPRTLFDLLTGN